MAHPMTDLDEAMAARWEAAGKVVRLVDHGHSIEEIADLTNLPVEEVADLERWGRSPGNPIPARYLGPRREIRGYLFKHP